MNYSVNGGPVQTDPLVGLSIPKLTAYNFAHSINWTPSSAGNYVVKFWADNINGANVDGNHANDTVWAYYTVVAATETKEALFEEYMQASCNPCMYAGPNIEPTLASAYSGGYCNSFRYHVNWPGIDYMNNETQTPFVNARVGYYGVNGVPDGKIDGNTDVSPASVSTGQIQAAANYGSPMKITINMAAYDPTNNKYDVNFSVKSDAAIPEGVIARVVLSVDTIKYDSNQSDEDPTSSFAAPLGSGSNPDSYYTYVKNFAQVAEDMLPSANGTALSPFTSGQTQTLNVSWTKNHPWGQTPHATHFGYDSTFPGEHVTVFIQEDNTVAGTANNTPIASYPLHALSGALATYVYQSASAAVNTQTGLEQLAQGVSFDMYPNPSNGNTTIDFSIDKPQTVTVNVYNAIGENVYTANQGTMESGSHTILIDGQNLKSGIYFVRFTTDNVTTTKKLVIAR